VSIYISRGRVGVADYSFTINVDTLPHHRFMLAITCLSVTSAKSDCPVPCMVTHIPLQWTELHLRPLEGGVTSPASPDHTVIPGGREHAVIPGDRADLVQPVQTGAGTFPVPPCALVDFGTRLATGGVIIAVHGGELVPGMISQTVTWNDTVLHTR
jgi:hypothetical protein